MRTILLPLHTSASSTDLLRRRTDSFELELDCCFCFLLLDVAEVGLPPSDFAPFIYIDRVGNSTPTPTPHTFLRVSVNSINILVTLGAPSSK